MRLIDADRLRAVLMREHGKYILSDHMQDKHVSAGFMLALAELDSQPIIMEIKEGYEIAEVRCKRKCD